MLFYNSFFYRYLRLNFRLMIKNHILRYCRLKNIIVHSCWQLQKVGQTAFTWRLKQSFPSKQQKKMSQQQQKKIRKRMECVTCLLQFTLLMPTDTYITSVNTRICYRPQIIAHLEFFLLKSTLCKKLIYYQSLICSNVLKESPHYLDTSCCLFYIQRF